uniref:Reverse transcriptase domain-containing protein n=1 Tax=Tanacetum cinerariifolium TaxID=118510 RepID=A0A699HM32_TANCI|nr:reverse transcriptase domain-containing protein [Tanacetum cinerariifolium]
MMCVLAGLLSHHEEGEWVDELVEIKVVLLIRVTLGLMVRVAKNQNGDVINDNIQGDVSRGCTYKEFLACNPKEYDGKGGDIVYTCWIEKMESVQDITGCRDSQKVKYTVGSLLVRLSGGGTLKSTHEVEKPL